VEHKIVDKSGSWFSFGSERLGQGYENVREFLRENPDLRQGIEDQLLQHLGITEPKAAASPPQDEMSAE
jgi:recombination protein RecA